jgi:hypothetical protein
LGWSLAPFWLRHNAEHWLDTAPGEKADLDKDVHAYLRALSLNVAPQAAAWSRNLAALISAGRDQEAVDSFFDGGKAIWLAIKEAGVDPVASWLVREPKVRAQALERVFAERARRAAGGQTAKLGSDWNKHLKEDIADWTGELSDEQQALVEDFTAHAAFPSAALEADRKRREQALVATLNAGAPLDAVKAQLRAWWLNPESDRDRACTRALQDYFKGLHRMFASLLAGLSPTQRDRLVRRLNALAQDLDGIHRKALASSSP